MFNMNTVGQYVFCKPTEGKDGRVPLVCMCSETALTGETRFHCESGCIPGTRTADFLDEKQTVDPLDQQDCVLG